MALQNSGLREIQDILVPSTNARVRGQDQMPDSTQTQLQEHPQAEELKKDQAQEQEQDRSIEGTQQAAASRLAPSAPYTNTAEFIPHLFYALHQIRKDPNNSSNNLETTTAFIRHRLKSCKSAIEGNDDCKNLLNKSTDEWREHIKNREKELEVKRNVLSKLGERISCLEEQSR